jgi:hypothetical protein
MSLDMLKVNAGSALTLTVLITPSCIHFGSLCISRGRSNLVPTFFVGARYQKVTVQLELNMQGARQSV